LDDPEFGRMAYTVSILLMFSFVILLLMLRSIKRSSSTLQMETLLEAMRFREELDIQERQRRRLLKAKTKVRNITLLFCSRDIPFPSFTFLPIFFVRHSYMNTNFFEVS
uniref:Neur_chan_memb domain-containing protein n=1 Tax=Haemonchus placei TaxID=6290 RepID=A0A0N4WI02_HAEPC